ncbi:Protein of unknown function [Propionibacterium cyclohexanicum]|uniref:DUF3040 domain-containing protein n=1 Tax=Propionibacterium cyclohexanicum TaxID=64702 RepID=A0A1H9PJB1_9ACTN|nr:DUF3040 domain-containing protein [Propionibacterium cyclohexanicum]SER48180.1 Protein of unknown function [Propionibacterium cyclohexanicum]
MPLSDEEQRMLKELEASLVADDPRLAHTLGSSRSPRQVHGRRAGLAGLGFLVGLVLLVAGIQTMWVISVIGFVVMLGCAVLALGAWHRASHVPARGSKGPRSPKKQPPSSGAFMNKMEDRWRRRQNGEEP